MAFALNNDSVIDFSSLKFWLLSNSAFDDKQNFAFQQEFSTAVKGPGELTL
jgi:hypothetical protein